MYKKNLLEYYDKNKGLLPITCILIIGTFLRFYKLDFQSLWLDELHTMQQAKPSESVKDLYAFLLCCDQHPPLFYLTAKFFFSIFGHTEFVARSIAATTGSLCVLALYFLGKELANKAVGLTAATFLAINFYMKKENDMKHLRKTLWVTLLLSQPLVAGGNFVDNGGDLLGSHFTKQGWAIFETLESEESTILNTFCVNLI